MSDQHYAVIFRGDIMPGHQLIKVKENLQKVFAVDEQRINQLFTGQPVSLKKNLSREAAQRYQSLLRKAGADVTIKDLQPDATAASHQPTEVDKNQAKADSSTTKRDHQGPEATETDSDQWQLAQVGSLLADAQQRPDAAPQRVDTDHLTLAPQKGNLIKDSEREATAEAAIDMDSLDWALSAYGEALLKEEERSKTPTVAVDTSQLTVAEAGADLVPEAEKVKPTPVKVDTSHLQLK
ncbi:MAG: hypothetical protein AAFZ92_05410 [Pseudomonadota bacterium]